MFGTAGCGIVACAQSDNRAAVQHNILIRINSPVRTAFVGHGYDIPAINCQVAVGIDAVAFCAQTGIHMQIAAVNGRHGYAVFIGVDAVILGLNVDIAAIQRQMEFGIQSLIIGDNGELSGSGRISANVHGHFGVERPIVFMEFFGGAFLVDSGYIGAAYVVVGAVGDDYLRSCRRQVGYTLCILTGAVGLVHIVENNGGGHSGSNIDPIENQLHYRIGILRGVLAKINSQLAG
ncbi:hypothetical protein D3C75_803690 [compost metagenome]